MWDKVIAIDTETDISVNKPFIITMAKEGKSRLFRVADKKDYQIAKKICEDSNVIKVFHNATSDIFWLRNIGINVVPPLHDTMIMASLLQSVLAPKGLKDLAVKYLNESCLEAIELKKVKNKYKLRHKRVWELRDLVLNELDGELDYQILSRGLKTKLKNFYKKYLKEESNDHNNQDYNIANVVDYLTNYCRTHKKNFLWSYIPKEYIEPYAVKDAQYTLGLYKLWIQRIKKNFWKVYNMELQLLPIVVDMESRGIRIDRQRIKEIISDINDNLIKIDSKIYSKLGFVNINSTQQLSKALLSIGVPLTELTESGSLSVSKPSLLSIKNTKGVDTDIIQCILQHKFLSRRVHTYYEPMLSFYTTDSDDIAHFHFYQSGTKTGRFSAELIQTIPKSTKNDIGIKDLVRHIFIPRENYINFYIDYNQIEFRLFAYYSRSKYLINYFFNGEDVFKAIGIGIFSKKRYDTNPKRYRDLVKRITYGLLYGMGTDLLSQTLGISYKKATDIIDEYDRLYGIKRFMRDIIKTVYRYGGFKLKWVDRRYYISEKDAYKAANTLIQATAAYCLKKAMINTNDYINKHGLSDKVNLILTIHDELVFEVHKSVYEPKLILDIKSCMEIKDVFKVPLTVDVAYSTKSWGDKQDWSPDIVDIKL